eukprot:jgi/Chrzof1/6820/UNPLg00888.t1
MGLSWTPLISKNLEWSSASPGQNALTSLGMLTDHQGPPGLNNFATMLSAQPLMTSIPSSNPSPVFGSGQRGRVEGPPQADKLGEEISVEIRPLFSQTCTARIQKFPDGSGSPQMFPDVSRCFQMCPEVSRGV